mmetsp:Transcript_36870/g.66314  ORF Transcript_36870/g.66314 Transcript_36870/m.66314 type:complete len:91 (-) Transcript_36870:1386-1658(-)
MQALASILALTILYLTTYATPAFLLQAHLGPNSCNHNSNNIHNHSKFSFQLLSRSSLVTKVFDGATEHERREHENESSSEHSSTDRRDKR